MLFGSRNIVPNAIDTITVPGFVGAIGMVACPGVRVDSGSTGNKRHFQADLQEIIDWGANTVVSLIEAHEFNVLKVQDLPAAVRDSGMRWVHLPIIDMHTPDQEFEDVWAEQGELIRHSLRIGERVLLHCYAGLGRTGMIAARLLVEMGMAPEEAIATARRDNRRRIQTKGQSDFVRSCYPLD